MMVMGDRDTVLSGSPTRSPREILTTDFNEFRIDDTPFAVGYRETGHKRRVDEIRDLLVVEMKTLRGEKGYASLLLVVVDIVHSQTDMFVVGMQQEVVEALGQRIENS